MTRQNGLEVLRDLVELRCEVTRAVAALRSLPWDADEELVTVTARDVRRVLAAFLEERVSPGDVALWADSVEGRDDIGYDSGAAEELKQLLFELSTPEMHGPIDAAVAARWLARLA